MRQSHSPCGHDLITLPRAESSDDLSIIKLISAAVALQKVKKKEAKKDTSGAQPADRAPLLTGVSENPTANVKIKLKFRKKQAKVAV